MLCIGKVELPSEEGAAFSYDDLIVLGYSIKARKPKPSWR